MDPRKTLWQIYIGIGFYAVVFMILGFVVMRPVWLFEISLLVGAVVAGFAAYNMYSVLNSALDLTSHGAKSFVTIRSVVRLVVCLLVMGIAINIHWVSFVGVTVGLLGLKVSAFFNPVIRKIPFVVRLTGDMDTKTDSQNVYFDNQGTDTQHLPDNQAHESDDSEKEFEDEYEDEFVSRYFKKYTKQKDRYM